MSLSYVFFTYETKGIDKNVSFQIQSVLSLSIHFCLMCIKAQKNRQLYNLPEVKPINLTKYYMSPEF